MNKSIIAAFIGLILHMRERNLLRSNAYDRWKRNWNLFCFVFVYHWKWKHWQAPTNDSKFRIDQYSYKTRSRVWRFIPVSHSCSLSMTYSLWHACVKRFTFNKSDSVALVVERETLLCSVIVTKNWIIFKFQFYNQYYWWENNLIQIPLDFYHYF